MTGAAGYLGSRLCERLLAADTGELIALDKFAKRSKSLTGLCTYPNAKIIEKDLSEFPPSDLQKMDVVVHLAAVVGATACDGNQSEATRTNLELTKALIEERQKGQVYIYANTNSGYSADGIADERSPLIPNSHYGKTKVEAEEYWLLNGGISLRFASLFGISYKMRDDLLLNYMVREAFVNKKLELFEPHFRRNFIHVDDAGKSIEHAIIYLTSGEAYNVNIEDTYTKEQIAKMIKEYLPETQITYKEGSDPDQRNYVVTSQKIRTSGFSDFHSVEDGIKELIKYYDYTL